MSGSLSVQVSAAIVVSAGGALGMSGEMSWVGGGGGAESAGAGFNSLEFGGFGLFQPIKLGLYH